MNYYILLIDIVLMFAIYFSLAFITNTISNIVLKVLPCKRTLLSIMLTAFFWALYDYLIFSQV